MIQADKIHKQKAIEILSECFEDNKTVNWIIKQDDRRKERIKELIDYSFEACSYSGLIYFTEDFTGVIMCNRSVDKMPILDEALLTLQFVFKVSGIEGIAKTLRRENYIKQHHPEDTEFIYIWFIGLKKSEQGKGLGASMLNKIISKSNEERVPIYLETSTEKNLHFYKKHGFKEYHVSDEQLFGFKLYFLRRIPE